MRKDQFRIMSTSSSKPPFWREALTFSRSERIGIMVLLMLAVSVWWIPAMFGTRREPAVTTIRMDSLLSKLPDPAQKEDRYSRFEQRSAGEKYSPAEIHTETFHFDPNNATPSDWQRLGLSDRTIATIGRFQEKGGKFRKPEDIRKIYGLSPQLAARLMPFVRITTPAAKDRPYRRDSMQTALKFTRPAPVVIDINQADSAAWESLPGIGPTLAGRIIKYRNRLGGFHRLEQVGETYGLADSVFRSIEHRLQMNEVPSSDRIPVNTATFEQLSGHPYIPYRMARAIIAYRDQHGPYKGRDDLMRIALMTPDGLERMLPYLRFD
jgi:competence protein ComEA